MNVVIQNVNDKDKTEKIALPATPQEIEEKIKKIDLNEEYLIASSDLPYKADPEDDINNVNEVISDDIKTTLVMGLMDRQDKDFAEAYDTIQKKRFDVIKDVKNYVSLAQSVIQDGTYKERTHRDADIYDYEEIAKDWEAAKDESPEDMGYSGYEEMGRDLINDINDLDIYVSIDKLSDAMKEEWYIYNDIAARIKK